MSDLIGRQAAQDVVNAICERCGKYKEYNGVMCGTCALDGVEDSIEDLPSAEPERKRGKWISGAYLQDTEVKRYSAGLMYCSVCKHEAYSDTDYGEQLFDYCPYCGARMVGYE